MKIIAYDRFKLGVTMETIQPLPVQEVANVWCLWKAGIVRENYARADEPGEVIVFELDSVEEAKQYVADFPMSRAVSTLIALSAGLPAVLGPVHRAFTFRGSKLHPRNSKLRSEMENTPPVLTKETTMWKAWIGFNASHGLGLLLFRAIYGYLALAQS